jgi:hypothetical protein
VATGAAAAGAGAGEFFFGEKRLPRELKRPPAGAGVAGAGETGVFIYSNI